MNVPAAQSSESSDLSDGPITVQEFMEVKSALNASEAKIQQLLKLNCHLSEELRMMQGKVGGGRGNIWTTLPPRVHGGFTYPNVHCNIYRPAYICDFCESA